MSKPCRVLFDDYYPKMNTIESHVVQTANTLRYLVIKSFYLNPKGYAITVVRWDEKSGCPDPLSLDEPIFYKELDDREKTNALYDDVCLHLEDYVSPYPSKRKEV